MRSGALHRKLGHSVGGSGDRHVHMANDAASVASFGVESSANSAMSGYTSGYNSDMELPSRHGSPVRRPGPSLHNTSHILVNNVSVGKQLWPSQSCFHPPGDLLSKSLTRVREMTKNGVLTKLEDLDERFLQKIFINVDGRSRGEIQMSEVGLCGWLPGHLTCKQECRSQ